MMTLIVQKTLVAVIALFGLVSPNFTTISEPSVPILEVVEIVSEKKIELLPELKPICGCESAGDPLGEPRQFNHDGTVLRGRINPLDIGACQINEFYWDKKAKELGYDIRALEGNILMSNYIYENYGEWPWKWSRPCWEKFKK